MLRLFLDGGIFYTGLLTVEFIGLLLAAWKAPGWVKEIGLIALGTGVFAFLIGVYVAAGFIAESGPISQNIIFGGLKVALIAPLYGYIIYGVSLVIRIIQKPRLL